MGLWEAIKCLLSTFWGIGSSQGGAGGDSGQWKGNSEGKAVKWEVKGQKHAGKEREWEGASENDAMKEKETQWGAGVGKAMKREKQCAVNGERHREGFSVVGSQGNHFFGCLFISRVFLLFH